MKGYKTVVMLVFLALLMNSCAKKADISLDEVKKRQLLVLVNGEPTPYCWTMAGQLGTAYAFGIIGAAGSMISATEKGKNFAELMTDYPLNDKILTELNNSLQDKVDTQIINVCKADQNPEDGSCVSIKNMEELKAKYDKQLVLVVSPSEIGLRNQKPYLFVKAALFDIESGNEVWQAPFTVKNENIASETGNVKYWKKNVETLKGLYDAQIPQITDDIVETYLSNQPSKDFEGWFYAENRRLKLENEFSVNTE